MSAEAQQDQSMEEILQSIKRIIADEDGENPEDATAQAAGEASDETSDAPSDDTADAASEEDAPAPLELTDLVEEDGTITKVEAAAEEPAEEAPLPDASALDDIMAEQPEPEAAPAEEPAAVEEMPAEVAAEPAPETPAAAPSPGETGDGLVSEDALAASASALQSLTGEKPAPVESTPSPAFRSGQTVEDLVMEALKPMLKEWLDANLPQTVEKLVQKEIRRITD